MDVHQVRQELQIIEELATIATLAGPADTTSAGDCLPVPTSWKWEQGGEEQTQFPLEDLHAHPRLQNASTPTGKLYARALHDYEGNKRTLLKFRKGDMILVINQLESGWWDGVIDGVRGWVPSNYCEVIKDPDEELIDMLGSSNLDAEWPDGIEDILPDEIVTELPLEPPNCSP